MDCLSFQLFPVPPFRLDFTAWTLRRRAHNLVDRWDDGIYRRVLLVRQAPVEVAVRQEGPPEAAALQVQARGLVAGDAVPLIKATLTRVLGLNENLTEFYRLAGQDRSLMALAQQFRGVKPPRFPTIFEALGNAIACQQLSLTAGIHILNRLASAYGPSLPGDRGPVFAFPGAGDLAGADPEALRGLGFSRSKGRTLVDLAQKVTTGSIDLESLEFMPDEAAVQYLEDLRGIGRWSAEYALLRGLGRWHIFPGDDVGARNKLQAWLGLPEPLDYQGVRRVLARWHPFGGLVYFHFLLSHLAEDGYIQPAG